MQSLHHLLVVTSCTDNKAISPPDELTLEDFRDPERAARRHRELAAYHLPAAEMYTGEQHVGVRNAVTRLRSTLGESQVELRIVSAGYGLIDEHKPIAPYNATFKGMPPA